MAPKDLPKVMRAWQYNSTSGGLENNLKLNPDTPIPKTKADQHLVRILAMAFNPVDYKPAEVQLLSRLAITKPAIPGIDFVGKLVRPASTSSLKEGQLVFGMAGLSPLAGAALAEYAAVSEKALVALPQGVSTIDGATIPVAGLTAYQSIFPYTKPGARVFINGGSGGTGIFGIQLAKVAGCFVTTTCSTPNVELCKSLGADEVIDYKRESVVEALKKQEPFDHVIDNVGNDYNLFWRAHEYTSPGTKYVYVAGAPTLSFFSFVFKAKFWPGFLGGAKRSYQGIFAEPHLDELEKIANWIVEGKIKTVVDQKIPFDSAPDGIRRQKTSRARGKIVVDIALESNE